jgi:hypothetical protein
MVWKADTRVYTGSGKNGPISSPRSLRERCACVVVLARCLKESILISQSLSRCGPCLLFYSFQGAQVTFVVKRWNGKKTKEKNKKGGLESGRLPPYPMGVVFPIAQRCNGRWSFGLSIHWCNILWPFFILCASVPSRMGGTYARICVERGLGGIVAITPVAVEVWMSSWWNDRIMLG